MRSVERLILSRARCTNAESTRDVGHFHHARAVPRAFIPRGRTEPPNLSATSVRPRLARVAVTSPSGRSFLVVRWLAMNNCNISLYGRRFSVEGEGHGTRAVARNDLPPRSSIESVSHALLYGAAFFQRLFQHRHYLVLCGFATTVRSTMRRDALVQEPTVEPSSRCTNLSPSASPNAIGMQHGRRRLATIVVGSSSDSLETRPFGVP